MSGLFGGQHTAAHLYHPIIGGVRMQTSVYGNPIPIVWGRNRLAGNLLWYGDFTAKAKNSGGGSAGKGGASIPGQTTYTYTASVAIGICEGPVQAIPTVWQNQGSNTTAAMGLSVFSGTYPQTPWTYIASVHPSQAVPYPGVAYVAAAGYALDSSGNLPNHTFEVAGRIQYQNTVRGTGTGIVDADPKDILTDFLTNATYGANPTVFPAVLGDWTQYSNYCCANGLFLSPVLTQFKTAAQFVQEIVDLTNSAIFESEGLIKIVPYGDQLATGNNATFTPNVTPVYDLTDDDFIYSNGKDPVEVKRGSPTDAFNQTQVKFNDRSTYYNPSVATAQDVANIEAYSLRPMPPVDGKHVMLLPIAQAIAQIKLQRSLGIRNQYVFTVGWRFILLEPMDIVTLTDSVLGMTRYPVRILEIAENQNGHLQITAEDFPAGIATVAQYGTQASSGYSVNYNQTPGNVMPPAFYERRVSGQIVVGIAVTGNNALWGGCGVWVSQDNATFKQIKVVSGRARYGSLNAATGATASDVFDVTLVGLGGEMLSGTAQDANQYVTECYVDGEIVSYETATLMGANHYVLSALRRGGYGTTAAAHAAGSSFIRVDDAIVESAPLDVSMIGQPLWFKFTSFNVFGGGQQQLADVQAFQYVVKGTPLYAQLANVQNLVDVFRDGRTMLTWDVVVDDRNVDYEIRKGATWETAQVLGRTLNTEFVPEGDGTYWVAGHADLAYSATPTSITLAGSVLVANIVATFDEEATLWSGSVSGGALVRGTGIVLAGAGLFSAITFLSGVSSVVYFGGVAPSGTYTVPVWHEVDVGTSQPCNCSVSYRLRADNPYALFSAIPDVAALASMVGNYSGLADARVQIAIAPDSGLYGAWRDFVPGTYVGRKFRFRVLLSSSDPSVTAILDTFAFTVDMPDRVERGTSVNCPAGGMTVTYARPFQVVPNVQITIQGAVQNDQVVLTGQSTTGFTVQVLQGGGVARTINWLAQGY